MAATKTKSLALPTPEIIAEALAEFRAHNALPEIFEVKTEDQAQAAGAVLRDVKQQMASLKAVKDSILDPLKASTKATNDLFRPQEQNLLGIETRLKGGLNTYLQRKENERRQEEARLRDAAAKEAARIEARAASLEARGKPEQAEAVRETAPTTPIVLADTDKIEGISSRGVWKFQIVDVCALIAAVSSGELPEHFVVPNEKVLGEIARSQHDQAKIPGVRIYKENSIAARA